VIVDPRLRSTLAAFDKGQRALASGVEAMTLPSGGVNHSWRVVSAQGDWVVRLGGALDKALQISRQMEHLAQTLAAAHGFAPTVFYAAPDSGALVMQYLDAPVWTASDAGSERHIQLLGERLCALHQVPVPIDLRCVTMPQVLTHYSALSDSPTSPISNMALRAHVTGLLTGYELKNSVFCHNDLHHQNLLGTQPLCFIDWEYAAAGDAHFELAAVISYHNYDSAQRELLLRAYNQSIDATLLKQMCRAFDCLHALWLNAAHGWDTLEPSRKGALLARLGL
jgi:thiamine kinase-like enzyme